MCVRGSGVCLFFFNPILPNGSQLEKCGIPIGRTNWYTRREVFCFVFCLFVKGTLNLCACGLYTAPTLPLLLYAYTHIHLIVNWEGANETKRKTIKKNRLN